jgi:hypothetical protein
MFSPGTGALGYRARTPPLGTEMGTCGPSSRNVPLAEWPGRSIGVMIPGVPGLDMVAEVCISSASPQISDMSAIILLSERKAYPEQYQSRHFDYPSIRWR